MPELPEVETVKRGLAPVMEGSHVTRVEVNRANLRFAFPQNFAARIENKQIREVGRRAKYLTVYFDDDTVLIMHLGMSGSFHIEQSLTQNNLSDRLRAHDHVIFHLRRGSDKFTVIYNDPRRFGFMDLIEAGRLNEHKYFVNLGIEPIGNSLNGDYIARLFTARKAPLKSALLDQKLIAGLGNIYVCEALWQAGLSPRRAAKTISLSSPTAKARAQALADAIRDVIKRAIDAGGSSLANHRQTDGSPGYFQHRFNVYDREAKSCAKTGCSGQIKRIVQSGRSTYYCANCQK